MSSFRSLPTESALNVPNRVIRRRKDLPFSDVCGAVDCSSSEERIDLSCFVYPKPPPSANSTIVSPITKPTEKPNTAKVRPYKPIDGLSNRHFAKLTKCVSCDTRWTTRKTVGQKMKHINSCARKKGLTDETIRVTVLKEIAITKVAVVLDSVEKEKERFCSSEAAPPTLLKNTMDAGKGARRRLPKTIQCVTQTRGAILEHAKEVLLRCAQITECGGLSHRDNADDDKDLERPSSTRPFGRSTFVYGRVSKGELFEAASIDVATKSDLKLNQRIQEILALINDGCSNLRP